MTLALVPQVDEITKAISEIENTQKMCAMLLKTKHYEKMGPEGVYAIVAKANSLHINPLEALNGGLYFVQGKVGMSSEMMASLIRGQGHSITKDSKSNDTVCILHGKRKDNGDTWTISFSIEDARRAGLLKNMYEKYPGIMLYNRAMSMLARQLFPDIIKGAGYTMDELKEIAKNDFSAFEPKKEEPIQEAKVYVSNEQAEELATILSECDPAYQETAINFMAKDPQVAATSFDAVPVSQYQRLKKAFSLKRDEALKKRVEQEPELLVAEA